MSQLLFRSLNGSRAFCNYRSIVEITKLKVTHFLVKQNIDIFSNDGIDICFYYILNMSHKRDLLQYSSVHRLYKRTIISLTSKLEDW